MNLSNSGTVRPVVADKFRFQPYFREERYPKVISTTKGSDILDLMLLGQYQNKPILRSYFGAFFSELDLLFTEIDKVYFGRMLDHAVGVQLDIIGEIIGQNRRVALEEHYFGFLGDPRSEPMADEATPADGGIFFDGDDTGVTNVPLNDNQYRRLLFAKSQVHTRGDASIDTLYRALIAVIGKVPRVFELSVTAPRQLLLEAASADTSDNDVLMLAYLGNIVTPCGTTLQINLV